MNDLRQTAWQRRFLLRRQDDVPGGSISFSKMKCAALV